MNYQIAEAIVSNVQMLHTNAARPSIKELVHEYVSQKSWSDSTKTEVLRMIRGSLHIDAENDAYPPEPNYPPLRDIIQYCKRLCKTIDVMRGMERVLEARLNQKLVNRPGGKVEAFVGLPDREVPLKFMVEEEDLYQETEGLVIDLINWMRKNQSPGDTGRL